MIENPYKFDGEYEHNRWYHKGDIVFHNGDILLCRKECFDTRPTDTECWTLAINNHEDYTNISSKIFLNIGHKQRMHEDIRNATLGTNYKKDEPNIITEAEDQVELGEFAGKCIYDDSDDKKRKFIGVGLFTVIIFFLFVALFIGLTIYV